MVSAPHAGRGMGAERIRPCRLQTDFEAYGGDAGHDRRDKTVYISTKVLLGIRNVALTLLIS